MAGHIRFGMATTWLLLLTLGCAAGAGAAEPVRGASNDARKQALANLSHPEVAVRRQAILQLGKLGTAADDTVLLVALRDPDPDSAQLAEAAIWQVWGRSGDKTVDAILNEGAKALSEGRLATSVELFSEAIKRKPAFAEAWNKRATAYFVMGDYQRSLKDCDQVMKRNPRHFGALAGYGQIYLRLDQPKKALGYFEQALDINPNMNGVSELIERIQEQLETEGGQTI